MLNLSPLLAGSEDINVPGWAIPHENANVTPGRYRVAAHLDFYNSVAETSNLNNIAYSPYFDIRHPDLITQWVSGVDTLYAPGSALDVTATVQNVGAARAWGSLVNPYRVAFYIGADQPTPPSPSAMSLLQTGFIQGNLDSGETTTDLLNTLVPLSTWPGRYKIWVKVDSDNELVESNENNNWSSSSAFSVTGPDLKPLDVTGVRSYYSPTFGQFIDADVVVQNIGAAAVVGSSLHWYLGPEDTASPPTPAERQLLQDADIRPMLSGGQTSDHLLYAVSGLQPGHYRIWAHADPGNGIGETDESNNWSYSDAFRIITIDNLRWEDEAGGALTGEVLEGTNVYACFDAAGFDTDDYIALELWEDDGIDDEFERDDLRALYDPALGRWRASWWLGWFKDTLADRDPEMYFHIPAEPLGFTFGYSSDNLTVKPKDVDFGFQVGHHTAGTGVPLVLVHGNNSDTAGKLYRWQWFHDHVRDNPADFAEFDIYVWKHDTSKPVGFNGAPGSQAASLANYIYGTLKVGVPGSAYENERVALVAHSQGGMVSRSFMNHANQGDDVSGLITLGTPHHGSPFGTPDWVAAVWEATDGTEATFTGVLSQMEPNEPGSINLAWDNMDGAIAGLQTTDFPLLDYDLTEHDTNALGPFASDRTPFYPPVLKLTYGTLAELNAAEAFYHKLVTIGAYDHSLTDNLSFAELLADLAQGQFLHDWSSEHDQLSAVTTIMGDMSRTDAGNGNGSPYYANDGLVPLQSALFLDIGILEDGASAKFSSLSNQAVTIDEALIRARIPRDMKAHWFSNKINDHQDILDGDSPEYWNTIVGELRLLLDNVIPTTSLHRPGNGETIGRNVLNRRKYFDLTYHDAGGSGLDPRSILDAEHEFSLSDPAASGVTITRVERQAGDTYRYFFDGQFARGNVTLNLTPGAFGDDAGNTNADAKLVFLAIADGDANLDGRVNADDYFRIDQGFLAQPAAPTYSQGDFNYDGRVNADDYFLIDQSFLSQPAPVAATAESIRTFSDVRVSVVSACSDADDADNNDDDARRRRAASVARARNDVFTASRGRVRARA